MRLLKGKSGRVTVLAFSPDGRTLAAGSYCRLDVWDVPAGTAHEMEMVFWGAPPDSLKFDPKGRRVLLGVGINGGLRLIDVRTRGVQETAKFDSDIVAVSPAGRVLVTTGRRIGAYDLTAKGLGPKTWTKSVAPDILHGLDFHPDGEQFATIEAKHHEWDGRWEGRVRVRAAADGRVLHEAKSDWKQAGTLRVSPSGEAIAFAGGRFLLVHEAADLARFVKVPNASKKPVTGIAFHPSGRLLAVASGDTTVRFHDRDANWAVAKTFDWEVRGLKSVAFSPDGTLAAAGGEKGQVVLWDVDV